MLILCIIHRKVATSHNTPHLVSSWPLSWNILGRCLYTCIGRKHILATVQEYLGYVYFNLEFGYTNASTQFCACFRDNVFQQKMKWYFMQWCVIWIYEGSTLYRDVISILGPTIQEGRPPHHNQCNTGEWESESEVHTHILYIHIDVDTYIILNSAHSYTWSCLGW